MKPLLWIAAFFISLPMPAHALMSGSIIQVSRKLRMSNSEPEIPRDYYIDVGIKDGVAPGQVLEISRVIAVSNGLWGGPSQLMRVVLGEIKVLAAENSVCRGRILSKRRDEDLPVMDYTTFMLGDEVRSKSDLPTQ